ncbi:MAG: hypothetical protein FWB91_04310 [Defluviitaleaceae bacterium]|nr:hypothetical protein [Defluviitaleaceae bacterium]
MFEKKQSHVICPFCCHRFHPNEADFRLPSSVGSVEKTPAKGRKKTTKAADVKEFDEKLYDYYIEILQVGEKDAAARAMQFPAVEIENNAAVSYSQEEMEKHGFAHRITYKPSTGKKITSDKRLCPNCHNDLPIGYGMRDTLLISILGDARSGKSVFLTMLIAELENNPDFVSKLNFIGDKQVRDSFYETYQKPLLKDHQLISSTKRKKIPPYAFNFWYQYKNEEGVVKENNIDLIFYDIAGEDLRDDSAIRQNGFNIKDSSGLIFLVDPTNFTRLSDLFRFSDSALIDAIPEENSNQNIFNTLYNYFLGFDREKSPIPMALVMSKSDLFNYVRFDFFDNKPENRIQNILSDEAHKNALNMRSVKGLNQEVREFLSHLGEDGVLNNALGCFKAVSCFAVSSLGKKPIVEQISDPITNETIEKGYIDGPLQPFRVKEAFYWILMRNQLLYKYENNRFVLHAVSSGSEERPTLWRRILAFFKR